MSLANLIRKRETGKPANANPAKAANDVGVDNGTLAGLATLSLANLPESANHSPANEPIEKIISNLGGDSELRYSLETHTDIEPDAVILTLAIRGKAACELRIPKSRYDGIALLELIEKHTTREILQ